MKIMQYGHIIYFGDFIYSVDNNVRAHWVADENLLRLAQVSLPQAVSAIAGSGNYNRPTTITAVDQSQKD